ncbi:type I restriction enzyme HsdR N-terminal domain-containing protein [Elizabethkingia meningoseptica]|uniref:type I restriction enzyme HsdR N-terminal domain-containing protein n=1 Tax=Elizabethkingia meningoseptica TaxID=238 RepID=UPI0008417282|nr:type I restriction enzyme HsdR N-terminal domain-containing protein [Elizabethkingia meningoseptica]ODM55194.1 hypothetical protein BES09_01700 [Elizabethkingia meningoseptica]OHT30399.1 hypothetical protein BFF93_01705 [Elizabethkingia meningoseptica]OPC12135.1 hypothetical protein BAX93_06490 [Elizabethkingia meningoseptica]
MFNYNIEEEYLQSESDVEQKIILPLLTNNYPDGLDYSPRYILTKHNLKKFRLDKGQKTKIYYPDYVINIDGVPSLVIEAKKPHEDLEDAYREACLYATEINRFYATEINPCKYIIACDGIKILFGYYDSNPIAELRFEDLMIGGDISTNFIEEYSYPSIKKHVETISQQLRKTKRFYKPLFMLGGKYIQNKQTKNTFGESISIQYRHLFNPIVDEEMIDVVKNAYVTIGKHESHINPIDKLIRKKIVPSVENSVHLEDSSNPQPLIEKLREAYRYNNQVLLLIGSVGSGKSTFSTYLKEVALSKDIREKLTWIRLDLNNAPVNREDIYSWVRKSVISQIKEYYRDIDFDEIETIKKLYRNEIDKFDKIAKPLIKDEVKYNLELYNNIQTYIKDDDITLDSLIENFLIKDLKTLIIVLDNCDKRNLKEQLLMFEVANWIKERIKAIVFLPLRDTTYDHHRTEKPLDTVIKDLTFRITPPSLEKIIYKRFKYASRLSDKSESGQHYYLPNGIAVSLPKKDELFYLKCILSSLFQNPFFKKVIAGLAGSNIRYGIELFLDFCKSGHISENDILRIQQNKGDMKLPYHVINKVFFRSDRVYYKDESSKIKNLFFSDPKDKVANPFTRIHILKWLQEKANENGDSGVKGFHSIQKLLNELMAIGCEEDRLKLELLTLLRQRLIISESQDTEKYQDNDLISINSSGAIHLDLLYNIEYLSTCSEDTWIDLELEAQKIQTNLAGKGASSHLSLTSVMENAGILVEFLHRYYENNYKVYNNYIDNYTSLPFDFEKAKELIEASKYKTKIVEHIQFKKGEVKNVIINNITRYGIFVSFEESEKVGYLRKELIPDTDFEMNYSIGEKIEAEIICFNDSHQKYEVKLPDF